MKNYLFLLFLFTALTSTAIDIPQSTAIKVILPGLYYDPGTYDVSSALILDSTTAVTGFTCYLTKGVGTASQGSPEALSLTASGDINDCTRVNGNQLELELTASNTDTIGGLHISITLAGHLPILSADYQVVPNPVDFRADLAGRIEDVTVDITYARNDLAGRIESASKMVIAGGNIIPASGMTRPIMSLGEIIGDYERNLWLEGLSTSDATPTVEIDLFEASGTGDVLWATQAAFTYARQTTYDGFYKHRFKWSILNNHPDDWYIGMFRCQVEGNWVASPFSFQKSATAVIDTSNLLTLAVFNSFVHNASRSFDALMSGHPNNFQMFTTNQALDRAQIGVSSAQSRHATAGAIYGASVSYPNYFDDEIKSATWLYDYNETDETRSANFNLTGSSLEAQAAIDGVTITTAGGS